MPSTQTSKIFCNYLLTTIQTPINSTNPSTSISDLPITFKQTPTSMDFFKKAMDSATSTDDNQKPSTHPQVTHTTSHTELFASAKVLAEAAQSSVQNKAVDKAKVAEAADDVLHAASEYGKLEERGYGQYVEKAETYLHGQFNSGDPSAAPPATTAEHSAPAEPKESEKSEGGLGDVMKMAQGFMK